MLTLSVALLVSSATPEVTQYWYDGYAELAGYKLTQPRYGEARDGAVVLITVTEPFSEKDRIKAEDPKRPAADVFPVIKVNVVKDFQTGIYDYNVMTSVFAAMDSRAGERAGAPTKLTFSMQEWCGMVFEELLFDSTSIRHKRFSYFDGEGDQSGTLTRPKGGISADELWLLARNLPAPMLKPGETMQVPLLPALDRVRMAHRPLAWTTATLTRSKTSRALKVPAGTFKVETFTAKSSGGSLVFYVEQAFPQRIIAWDGPQQERGELTGVVRRKYWNENREGHEKLLSTLGLKPVGGIRVQ